MKKNRSNIEGFVLRRPGAQLGALHGNDNQHGITTKKEAINRPVFAQTSERAAELGKVQSGRAIGRSDIDESLNQIDESEPVKKLTRKQRRLLKKMSKKPRHGHKVVKRLLIFLAVVILALGGFVAYRFVDFGGRVLQGNILDIFQSKPLKQDANGRSNFLILGTTEDDPNHPGANLTDSMLVVSLDQKNKNVYMFNVPRDLYVDYGMACFSGYAGKINAYFSCVNDGTTGNDEQDRLTQTQKLVGDIFGLDIQYGAHINETVLKDVVDAIGGVDVDIKGSDGAPGILDRNFDWRCKFTCYYVKYDNGVHHLDGIHALFLAQARGDVSPTYGLANSNFDREKNQQKILIAIKNKATSSGILTNLGAVSKIMDTVGNNLRTNIKTDEIRTLMRVANDTKPSNIHTISLVDSTDSTNSVVKAGDVGGASVVLPVAGLYEYGDLQSFIHKSMLPPDAVSEAAPIAVFNGSGQSGLAQTEANKLTAAGLTVTQIDTAPAGDYSTVEIYQIGTGNSATAKKIASTYGVTIKTSKPPVAVNDNVRFVIILGPTTG